MYFGVINILKICFHTVTFWTKLLQLEKITDHFHVTAYIGYDNANIVNIFCW